MHRLLKNRTIYNCLVCLGLLTALAALALFPQDSVAAARDGLDLCLRVIIPSLFPFFVLSNMTVELGLARRLGRVLEPVMRPLFNVGGPCAAAFALGFIGGYPVGAKTAISLYRRGDASKAETERLLSFCNNSGPAFILGVVGAGVFSSSLVGLLLYLAHALSSVCVGIVFRRWGGRGGRSRSARAPEENPPGLAAAFTGSVASAFNSVLGICGFVVFFTVIIKLLFISGVIPGIASLAGRLLGPLGVDSLWVERLLTGIIELSSGVTSLEGASMTGSLAMAAFMLGWAGLSVHCQVLSFIGGSGLSVKTYLLGKLLHGLFSAGAIYLLTRLVPLDAPVAVYLAQQVGGMTGASFISAFLISIFSSLTLFVFFLAAAMVKRKRR